MIFQYARARYLNIQLQGSALCSERLDVIMFVKSLAHGRISECWVKGQWGKLIMKFDIAFLQETFPDFCYLSLLTGHLRPLTVPLSICFIV